MHIFHTHPARPPGTPGTDTPRARLPLIFSLKKDVMENKTQPLTKKIIHCTPDNARDMQQAVKDWPELHSLVKGLQSQDLFPGLRGLRITITGDEQLLAQGLGAIKTINASKAV